MDQVFISMLDVLVWKNRLAHGETRCKLAELHGHAMHVGCLPKNSLVCPKKFITAIQFFCGHFFWLWLKLSLSSTDLTMGA